MADRLTNLELGIERIQQRRPFLSPFCAPMDISISVVIPTYNRVALLMRTLESIRNQTQPVQQIIVIDDASQDGTADLLRLEATDISLLEQDNRGPGAARNRGVVQCSGDYVAFLDSDDLWLPWTAECYRRMIVESGAAIAFGKPLRFQTEHELNTVAFTQERSNWQTFPDYLSSGAEWRWWGASSFVVRRDLLPSNPFCEDPINGEDADFILKLGDLGPVVQATGCPTFGYREHGDNIMKNLDKTVAGAWHLTLSEKNGSYPGGVLRQRERLRILGRHLRPVILEMMRCGRRGEAWRLFAETLPWHLRQNRWRFIAATIAASLTSQKA